MADREEKICSRVCSRWNPALTDVCSVPTRRSRVVDVAGARGVVGGARGLAEDVVGGLELLVVRWRWRPTR